MQEKFCKPLSEHLYSLVSTYFKKNVYLKDKYEFIAILHLAGRNRRGILDRIVGRRESNIRACPWVATVIIHDGVFKCGGSLLIETGYWQLGIASMRKRQVWSSIDTSIVHQFLILVKFHPLKVESARIEIVLCMLRRSSFSTLEQTVAVLSVYDHLRNMTPLLWKRILLKVQEPFPFEPVGCSSMPTYLGLLHWKQVCTVIGWGNVKQNGP